MKKSDGEFFNIEAFSFIVQLDEIELPQSC